MEKGGNYENVRFASLNVYPFTLRSEVKTHLSKDVLKMVGGSLFSVRARVNLLCILTILDILEFACLSVNIFKQYFYV